jgi:hypothetical protein
MKRVCGALSAGVLLVLAGTVFAYESSTPITLGLEIGTNFLGMSDVNSIIDQNNTFVRTNLDGSGTLEEISNGMGWNLFGALKLKEDLDLIFRLGRISAQNNYQTGIVIDNAGGQLEQEVTVTGYPMLVGILYHRQLPGRNIRLVGGIDAGILSSASFRNWIRVGMGSSMRAAYGGKGRGTVAQFHVGAEREVMPKAGVFMDLGYRYAKVSELDWDEYADQSGEILDPNVSAYEGTVYIKDGEIYGSNEPGGSSKMSLDFSGVYLAFGLRIHF